MNATAPHDLIVYRRKLARRFIKLRLDSGYTQVEAAGLIGIDTKHLRLFENARWRPTLSRVIRMANVYGADPLATLCSVLPDVKHRDHPEFEALLYFCGVTPQQLVVVSDSAPEPDRKITRLSAPIGRAIRYLRDDDPLRIEGGRFLRQEYEKGASIRALVDEHDLAFGTVRRMLVEAGAKLRSPGAPPHEPIRRTRS